MTGRVRTPYEETSVSVERSKDAIRGALRSAGALGVQFDEEWGVKPVCRVRFVWPVGEGTQVVRIEVNPLPPVRGVTEQQRERQAWRGVAHYLDGTLKAATFGLIRFEDIFLSFMEISPADPRRIGDVVVPRIHAGRLELGPG